MGSDSWIVLAQDTSLEMILCSQALPRLTVEKLYLETNQKERLV